LANYYTPPALAKAVVTMALEGVADPLRTTVLDPACGTGNLLAAAAAQLQQNAATQFGGLPEDYRAAVERNLVGVDLDSNAIETARAQFPLGKWEQADALRKNWGDARYDVVVANPPFYNPMRSDQRRAESAYLDQLHPELTGGADTAAHFAWMALQLSGGAGRGVVIVPRALFSSPRVKAWRERVGRRATHLYAPQRGGFFDGAAVFVGVVAWAGKSSANLRVSLSDDPDEITWKSVDASTLVSNGWWGVVSGESAPRLTGEVPLGRVFEVEASLTMGQAYALKDHIVDSADGDGWKLLTTGLIDPGRTRWGLRRSLNFGRHYLYPRIPRHLDGDAPLRRKWARARRPKVVVAGLTAGVEGFLDLAGEYLGTVTTWTLTHPKDSVEELTRLQAYLSTPEVSAALRVELGASAYGTSINVTRPWLERLPLPWNPEENVGALALLRSE
jgi:SAM-dependent methyltransferase